MFLLSHLLMKIKPPSTSQLDRTILTVRRSDKLAVLGDFNAWIVKDHELWKGIICKHGIGKCNANEKILLGFCAEHQLIVTNTIFQLPNRQKTTWKKSRSTQWHTLDYALMRTNDRRDIRITRSMAGADDCWKNHRLLISHLNHRLLICHLNMTKTNLIKCFSSPD